MSTISALEQASLALCTAPDPGRDHGPQCPEVERSLANAVLDAIGYDALVAERDGLREALHTVWCEIPPDTVVLLEKYCPEVVALCKQVHHDLWHATTHEQRMMQRGGITPQEDHDA
jgi:hypothetical protein